MLFTLTTTGALIFFPETQWRPFTHKAPVNIPQLLRVLVLMQQPEQVLKENPGLIPNAVEDMIR